MTIGTRARRLTYLIHRWTGIAGCVLMLIWFVSGIVMLYVGYPKLTPWERLGAMPTLDPATCCVPWDKLPEAVTSGSGRVVLTAIRGEPHYVVGDGVTLWVFSARNGEPLEPVGPEQALAAARSFAPGAAVHHDGEVHEDRWTRSRSLAVHRPLHRVQLKGDAPGTLYVSSATGQIVLDAPLAQQRWNYIGAWLHWLYMFRTQSVDPRWSWLVIALSAMGTFTAVSGVVVGVWRWRFRRRYKSGAHTPYRERWMRWHHIVGLSFGALVCTWVFSGLMSMNPFGIFSTSGDRPDLSAFRGEPGATDPALRDPARLLRVLNDSGFNAVELQWRRLGGRDYVLAHDTNAESRLVRREGNRLSVASHWRPEEVMPAAERLFKQPITGTAVLTAYDAYYYQRHPEAMNGHVKRGLPALRLDFADANRTRAYIDLSSGEVALTLGRSQRVGRWLFYFLHSWDTPFLLRGGVARDVAIIVFSLGGLALAATGVVIGWRRLRASRHLGARPGQ